MEIAGVTAAMSTFASSIFAAEMSDNNVQINISDIKQNQTTVDVLVIGGGVAGLFAAVKAHDSGAKVVLVSKGRLGSSGQTPFAKGIFAYDPKTTDISLDEFTKKVSASALGTNNPVYTRQMAEHSLARVNELKEWGFFKSKLYHDSFSKPLCERKIDVIERVVVTHLIKENGKIAGAAGFSLDKEKVYFFNAKAVILCTGAGGFKPNGFPICDLTHDGTVMAYNIGARVTGKEWNDGHSGSAVNPAACYDGWGEMFERTPSTTSVEIHHDLGVDLNYAAYKAGNPMKMDRPGMVDTVVEGGPYVPDEFKHREGRSNPGQSDKRIGQSGESEMFGPPQRDHFGPPPRMDGNSGRGGGRPGRDGDSGGKKPGGPGGKNMIGMGGASAGMSIHKAEGLVPLSDKCESNIPGLYAAGDALGSYTAGAIYTQVGSSMAGSAVQGAIAGTEAATYSKASPLTKISDEKRKAIQEEILTPLKRTKGYGPAWVTQTLQGIMIPNFILYIKKENLLRAALAYIEELKEHHMPLLRAADMHELRLAHETANMIISAEMKLKTSILRKESRCSHYRLDYPNLDKANWQAWINIYKGSDGKMKFEKQDFDSWPDQGKELAFS